MNRDAIAKLILERLNASRSEARRMYENTKSDIGYFFVDDLLPIELATKLYASFPPQDSMKLKKSLREYKYIAAQMNQYESILEEVIYAFQDERVVKEVASICDIERLYPDNHLYAGGISLMGNGQYLNPHLDNSHDKDRKFWRVLNLLYYVSPEWKQENGGNLELWPNGPTGEQVIIHSRFNRLAVMATHDTSWHSVSPIRVNANRCCISNYYFSPEPLRVHDRFHVTRFRGRPGQPIRDIVLRADALLRMGIRKIFKKGLVDTGHRYKKV